MAEDLTVERDIAVLDRQPDQPALLYAALDRVPRQKGHTPVNLEHTDEQRGIAALERRGKYRAPRGKTAVEHAAVVILLGEEERLLEQLLDRQLAAAQLPAQRRRGHEHDLLALLHQLVPVVAVQRLIEHIDHIQLAALHLFDQLLRFANRDTDGDLRIVFPVKMQYGRQLQARERLDRADMQRAVQLRRGGDRQARLIDLAHDLAGMIKKTLARVGQRDALAHAVEQARVQFLLELADLYGYSRLRIAEALRCARKAVELRHADERCKLTDLHVFSLSSVIKNFNPNDRIYELDLIA